MERAANDARPHVQCNVEEGSQYAVLAKLVNAVYEAISIGLRGVIPGSLTASA